MIFSPYRFITITLNRCGFTLLVSMVYIRLLDYRSSSSLIENHRVAILHLMEKYDPEYVYRVFFFLASLMQAAFFFSRISAGVSLVVPSLFFRFQLSERSFKGAEQQKLERNHAADSQYV